MKIEKLSLQFLAFLQATGLLLYIYLVSLFILNANQIFGPIGSVLGPIAFLLLFVVSAIISGLLVLANTGFLFWDKKYKEALTLLGWTTAWSVFYLLFVLAFLFLNR